MLEQGKADCVPVSYTHLDVYKRQVKMYLAILGFQRRVWWPKWTPASRSCFIDTTAIVCFLQKFSFYPPHCGVSEMCIRDSLQVLLHGQAAEYTAALRHLCQAQADDLVRLHLAAGLAAIVDLTALQLQDVYKRKLPHCKGCALLSVLV